RLGGVRHRMGPTGSPRMGHNTRGTRCPGLRRSPVRPAAGHHRRDPPRRRRRTHGRPTIVGSCRRPDTDTLNDTDRPSEKTMTGVPHVRDITSITPNIHHRSGGLEIIVATSTEDRSLAALSELLSAATALP